MYLRRLELHGFKTFADRTELEFGPGITAIVGPNGSGKSNVFDAIRWTLGEMSFKSLRSGRMDDVIFSGSEARRAMGQAEASLTINNESHVLPVDYAEVTVTRRANRGGEGEYFLNDSVCRLRDIQMMFLGTGLGGRSYSLIGQGQVDSVLSAGAEDRRVLLEEAAGLARYKRRRREAERRLQHTAINLQRVGDVLAELERQTEQLREQAESAAQHHAHTTEMRNLELGLQVDEARRLVSSLKRISTQAESVQQQLHETAAQAAATGSSIDRDRARSAEVARSWEDVQRALLQIVEDLSGRESAMQLLQERLRHTDQQRERIGGEISRMEQRLAQVEEALTTLQAQGVSMRDRREDLLEQLALAEESQTQSSVAQRERETLLRAQRAEMTDLSAAKARGLHDQARLDARAAALTEQIDAHRSRVRALTASAEQFHTQVQEHGRALEGLRARRDEILEQLAEVREHSRASATALDAIDREDRDLNAEQQVVQSTLAFLEDMQRQLAGYEQGVKEILLAKRAHPERFGGIKYPLAELLTVAPAYRSAIEAALGRRLFSLIAGTVDDVKDGVSYLRRNGQGSATFLPVELVMPRPAPDLPAAVEVIGRAADLVQLTNGARQVVDALLGDVIVVTDLDAAVQLRRSGFEGRIATLQGELLSPDGVISVRGKPDGVSGLLGREDQIRSLGERRRELEERAAALVTRREATSAELRNAEAAIASTDAALRGADQEIAEGQEALAVLRSSLAAIPAELHEVRTALERGETEHAQVARDAHRLRADLELISQTLAEREQVASELETEVRRETESSQTASGHLTDVRVSLAEVAGTLEALHARVDEHAREGAAITTRRDELLGELTVLDGERHLLVHSLEEAREAHRALAELQEATRAQLSALEEERAALQQRLMESEGAWRQIQDRLRDLEDQTHRLEVRHAQIETELVAAQRRIAHEFDSAWDDVREVRLPLGRDEAQGRIEALRGLIAAIGPVNLRAVDEFQAVRSRVETLRTQTQDLERARAALSALIRRLDEILQVRFAETFAAVNEEFNRLFVRLFAGGRAQLTLVDPEPGPNGEVKPNAEPGIEIEAQLPGKKMRSLSAYSGGERVLIALSLIFAMLRVHPSPFCIFDEVEAALDDVNTKKFTTLLRELAERTQVLIITHNKGTMEAADVLYGVTMEVVGVSKIISMRLTRKDTPEPAIVA
ncbi:MAG: chromosome segregation protein SMC [Armatimonadetes bacterium]|nr:chromosome segregation protein SMC [Armatimonadota bacterium]